VSRAHRVVLPALALGCTSEPLSEPAPTPAAGAASTIGVLERVRVSSDDSAENVRRAGADVDFGAEPVARATLKVELESPCFPFDAWQDQDVPAGHAWPALCDAFDRALSVSLDDPADAEAGPPGLELLRAVTPFGGPLTMESDITDVVNGLPGPHRLTIAIDTWGDPEGQVTGARGEWIVTITVELEPGPAPRRVLGVQPLFFGSQLEPALPALGFRTPEGATTGRLEYRATGHGSVFDIGCRNPAEEFCPRTHSLALDGQPLDEFVAFRDDCTELCTLQRFESAERSFDYCAENPCGAIESVRAPRANWCPGSVTPPRVVESAEFGAPGAHQIETVIDELIEGGSWRVSLSYFAFE